MQMVPRYVSGSQDRDAANHLRRVKEADLHRERTGVSDTLVALRPCTCSVCLRRVLLTTTTYTCLIRVIVHLYLRPSDEDPSQLVISQQEDLYHPEDIIALLVPPLIPAVRFLLRTGAIVSNINARLFGMFGKHFPERWVVFFRSAGTGN